MTFEEAQSHYKELQQRARALTHEIRKAKELRDSLCPHTDTYYHPDASGNNDSSYICKACGQSAKNLKDIGKYD